VSRLFPLVCLLLTAIAMALSLAHVAEMPGKMRLDRETYLTVQQQLYYPGFTIGGIAEPLGALAILALLIFAPLPGVRFWWAALALGCLVAMQLVFWFVTQPVNAAWTRDMNLQGLGGLFFSIFPIEISGDWTRLRDIWEYSHAARAAFATIAFLAFARAIMA
jgi:hypothetical protein